MIDRRNLNLLYVLIRTHLRLSDYRSVMGALWSFAGPFLLFVVTYFIFRDRFGKQIPYYPLILITGIVALTFFTGIVNTTLQFLPQSNSILSNSKVPSEILLAASLFVPTLKFIVEMGLCLVTAVILGILNLLAVPIIMFLMIFFLFLATGIGLLLAALNSMAGDVGEIWPALIKILLFVTPIFYTVNMLSPWARFIVLGNPLTPFILSFQALVTSQEIPTYSFLTPLYGIIYAAAIFVIGYYFFKRLERGMIERL